MSSETEAAIVFDSNLVVTDHVEEVIRKAEQLVETCGCGVCRNYLQSWLDWKEAGSGPADAPPPPDPYGMPPDHPDFYPGDPPPPLDSGNLADWYANGI